MSIRVDTSGLDELIKALKKAEIKTGDACIKAVNKAAPILKESLQGEIEKAASRGYATGELAGSVSAMDARENEYGVFTAVGPRGEENIDKLLWLENGTKRKGNNLMKRAGPVRTRATIRARSECETVMQQEIEGFLDDTFGG